MKYSEQNLPGVFIIEPEPFTDERGIFRRHFCAREFKAHNICFDIKQCNVSENKFGYTLRGFHYQMPPFGEAKTLTCFKGGIYDIVVDLRAGSPTYLKWIAVELNESNRKSLHVPVGCANAFLTLRDNSLIFYYCSEFYNPGLEKGIRYNDPVFKFKWAVEPRFISEKDKNHPDFTPETGSYATKSEK